MDMLGAPRDYRAPINIHINNTKGDPADIAARFMANLAKCDDSVQSRLVVENEDKGIWTPKLLAEHFNNPITYDNLHHKCNPGEWSTNEAFERCYETWNNHGCCPLFHYSEGGANNNPRAHTDFSISTPKHFRDEHDTDVTRGMPIDWDVELKQKDYAIQHLQEMENKMLHAA